MRDENAGAIVPLSQINDGGRCRIVGMSAEGRMLRRLTEMGVTPGTDVQVVKRAPLGDPIEIEVRGYLLAVRREIADKISVVCREGE